MIEIGHQQPAKRARPLEQGIESDGPAEIVPDSGKAHGRASYFSACRQHLRSQHAHPGMLRQVADHGRNAIVQKLYVRIHQADVIRRGLRDPDVVGLGEAKVLRVANQLRFRKHFRHQLRSSVARSVIDDDHFRAHLAAMLAQGFETLHHIPLGVPHHDDHRNLRGTSLRPGPQLRQRIRFGYHL